MRRTLIILGFLVLACAVANLIIAIVATNQPPSQAALSQDLHGPDAAAIGWPAPTPLPWPAVTDWADSRAFAYRRRDAWSSHAPPETSHQMAFEEFGWPLPVLERVQLWWPWKDPKWATSVPADSGLRFRWGGFILNSALQATAIWLLAFGPLCAVTALRRRHRTRRGECLTCAYPLHGAAQCPECGGRAALQAS